MPPPITVERARAVHGALLASGFKAGDKIARRDFDTAISMSAKSMSAVTIQRLVETGRVLGLWLILDGGPRRGALRILDPARRQDAPEMISERDHVEA
jgi:hypothetical protein